MLEMLISMTGFSCGDCSSIMDMVHMNRFCLNGSSAGLFTAKTAVTGSLVNSAVRVLQCNENLAGYEHLESETFIAFDLKAAKRRCYKHLRLQCKNMVLY